MSIETFLNRLEKVKRRGHGQWMACCPVHQEKTPSLSIKDDNGTILIHCFGCGAGGVDVCGAVGIEPSELFPPSDHIDYVAKPKRAYFPADQVLEALQTEILVTHLVANHMVETGTVTPELQAELKTSMIRIWEASNYIRQ